MKKIASLLLVLSLVLGMSSCGDGVNNEETPKDGKAVILEQIEKTKVQLEEASKSNKPSYAEHLVTFYTDYANQYPQDSLAPEMLFSAGNVYIGLGKYDRAIAQFNRIDKHYKDYIKRPEAIYLAGFVADYHQSQKGEAKKYYERVIELYPNHIFAADARKAIEALSMSDEDLVKMFQEKNKKEDA